MSKSKLTKEQLNKLSHEELAKIVLEKQAELEELSRKVDILTDQVNLQKARFFGRKTEQSLNSNQITFNELEGIFDSFISKNEGEADTLEPEIEEVTYKRRKRKGKRDEDLSNLEAVIIEHELSEDELNVEFPNGYSRLPDEVYRKLEYKPAEFIVLEHHLAVYKGRDGKILKTPHPNELFDHSIATPSLVAAISNAKFVNALPIARVESEFGRNDLSISRQTMSNWIIKSSERYLSLVYDQFCSKLKEQRLIHADETPVKVNKDGRKAGSKSYMWVYSSEDNADEKIIVYDYHKTRSYKDAKEFLDDYKGVLVTDGYEVYHKIAKEQPLDIVVSGCWAHTKRKFAEVIKSSSGSEKKKPKYSLSSYAVAQIDNIYHMDKALKELDSEERYRERQSSIKPLVDGFFDWVREHQSDVTSGSNIGKAFTYALNQEKYLRTFLDYPEVPLDNNTAERAIRPFCLGKKNWVMIDTIHGAEASAVMYSIAETAKANNLKPYMYFKHLLTEIPKHMDDTNLEFIDELMPWSAALPEECRQSAKTE